MPPTAYLSYNPYSFSFLCTTFGLLEAFPSSVTRCAKLIVAPKTNVTIFGYACAQNMCVRATTRICIGQQFRYHFVLRRCLTHTAKCVVLDASKNKWVESLLLCVLQCYRVENAHCYGNRKEWHNVRVRLSHEKQSL